MSNNSELANQVSQKFRRAIVTGGAGFIGSHIIEALLPTGIEVVAVDDLSSGKRENIASFEGRGNFRFCEVDVSDEKALSEALSGADIVFHNAASKKNICLTDPRRDLAVNAGGAFNIFDIAHRTGIKKIVHASTG
jgi:nucleoside-diphosphate-sugar epimerase